jgi:ADP-ribosyl-[dinitrogen reductase] hydrolase
VEIDMTPTKRVPDRGQRMAGGLIGLLVGDALGVPYEFNAPAAIPDEALLEFQPPSGFVRSHAGVAPGTWSDDGAQALCLLASLQHCNALDLDDFSRRLLNWYEHGYLAVDNNVFDVGIATAQALRRLREGVPPERSGGSGEHSNGNGSLMRVLPLALWHRGSDAQLIADAQRQSLVTHTHPRAQVCCALYCLMARRLLDGSTAPWPEAVAIARRHYAQGSAEHEELEFSIRPDLVTQGTGTGYVVDCLRSAVTCLDQPDYARVVRAAIRLGHDTDTTACVAGGLAGIRHGVDAIPQHWRTALRGMDVLQPLLDRLLRAD